MESWLLAARIRWILASEDERPCQVYRLRQLADEHAVDTALDVLGLGPEDLQPPDLDDKPS